MMIKKLTIASLAITTFLMSGCAQKTSQTVGTYQVKELTKDKFDKGFEVGKMRLAQAKAKLGKPADKLRSQGFDFYTWTYGIVEGENNGLVSVPYANILFGKAGGKSTQKSVTLGFDDKGLLAHKKWNGTNTVDLGLKGLFAK